MYDANSLFTFMIMRSDLPKFASNSRAQATAEEGKAVAQGMIAFYGTYTVNEGDKTVTTRIEGSSYPNLIDAEQKRVITSLTSDELRFAKMALDRHEIASGHNTPRRTCQKAACWFWLGGTAR